MRSGSSGNNIVESTMAELAFLLVFGAFLFFAMQDDKPPVPECEKNKKLQCVSLVMSSKIVEKPNTIFVKSRFRPLYDKVVVKSNTIFAKSRFRLLYDKVVVKSNTIFIKSKFRPLYDKVVVKSNTIFVKSRFRPSRENRVIEEKISAIAGGLEKIIEIANKTCYCSLRLFRDDSNNEISVIMNGNKLGVLQKQCRLSKREKRISNQLLFAKTSARLVRAGEDCLRQICPKLIKLAYDAGDYLRRFNIEGHTSTPWGDKKQYFLRDYGSGKAVNCINIFECNRRLSVQRSLAVNYLCKKFMREAANRGEFGENISEGNLLTWYNRHVVPEGMSSKVPLNNDGKPKKDGEQENRELSRRVQFRFSFQIPEARP